MNEKLNKIKYSNSNINVAISIQFNSFRKEEIKFI
jgi:hypothetical protein